jgi:hypothetical protein
MTGTTCEHCGEYFRGRFGDHLLTCDGYVEELRGRMAVIAQQLEVNGDCAAADLLREALGFVRTY